MSKKDKKTKKNKKDKKQQSAKLENINWKILKRAYKVFAPHYKTNWKLFAVSIGSLFVTALLSLITPWALTMILDHVVLKQPLPHKFAFLEQWFGSEPTVLLAVFSIAFVVISSVDSIVSYLQKVGFLIVGVNMSAEIRERIFKHLQKLSLSFHEVFRSGDLVFRLTSDLREMPMLLIGVPVAFFGRIFIIVTHMVVMLSIEWRLALIAFSVMPILYYYNRRTGSGMHKATKEKRSKEGNVTSLISENVTGMALVQAYGREDLQHARFQAENRKSLQSGLEAMKLSKIFKRVTDMLTAVGTAGVVYYGGHLALDAMLSIGTVVLFTTYLRKLYSPLDKFAEMFLDIAKSQVSAERILELLEYDNVVVDTPHAVPAPPLQGRLEFRNVDFAYAPGVEVFKNLNLKIAPGEVIAIVGHSGAGKSTFVNLLLRFYEPQGGEILFDGQPSNNFTLQSLRSQMTVVMQDARLFNKTVRENLAFGKPGVTEEEIVQAAKLAQAHDFIMAMPEGYDTMIAEGGDNLSGGQKQRLNIARAIVRNTPIMILDEPATALDARTEANIHAALESLMAGKTVFIIAHKFSTISRADKILVLEKGRDAMFGTHEELMRTSRSYRELYELQLRPLPEPEEPAPAENSMQMAVPV
ncbi:ABC transporter ATP-binding protein [candidate division KSB1 bacterium]|nr:ABC transporter ATP-binding protein [candidate division KSB1 bacterium]